MHTTTENPATEFIIGAAVIGEDGGLGELKRVVIDPIRRTITHLVVEAPHRRGGGHLVPVTLVTSTTEHEIRLGCTSSHFATLDAAEEVQFNPGAEGAWSYEQAQMYSLPYYPMAVGIGGRDTGPAGLGMRGDLHPTVLDRIPPGEVEVRRGDPVQASDGEVGRVEGLIIDPRDHCVTHVLVHAGHLWGKRSVSIPIAAVTRVDAGIGVELRRQEIEALPAVDVVALA